MVSGDFWAGFGCGMKGRNAGGSGEIGERIGSDSGRCLGSGFNRTKGKGILVLWVEKWGEKSLSLSGWGSARKKKVISVNQAGSL